MGTRNGVKEHPGGLPRPTIPQALRQAQLRRDCEYRRAGFSGLWAGYRLRGNALSSDWTPWGQGGDRAGQPDLRLLSNEG